MAVNSQLSYQIVEMGEQNRCLSKLYDKIIQILRVFSFVSAWMKHQMNGQGRIGTYIFVVPGLSQALF